MDRLRSVGVNSFISDPVTEQLDAAKGRSIVVALRDPDGAMVELVQTPNTKRSAFWVHVNTNVTGIKEAWPWYKSLGFKLLADLGAPANDFYKALKIPDPGLTQRAYLLKLPGDPSFMLDLIEWKDPKTVGRAPVEHAAGIDGMTIIVDGPEALQTLATAAGQPQTLQKDNLPGIGLVQRVTLVDPDGARLQAIARMAQAKL